MSQKPKSAAKKRGRPATGRDPVVAGRIPKHHVDEMDALATKHKATRSTVMARLVEFGLEAAKTRETLFATLDDLRAGKISPAQVDSLSDAASKRLKKARGELRQLKKRP